MKLLKILTFPEIVTQFNRENYNRLSIMDIILIRSENLTFGLTITVEEMLALLGHSNITLYMYSKTPNPQPRAEYMYVS